MDIYTQLAESIIKEQQLIIGPLALIEAKKVPGITIEDNRVTITGENKSEIINILVKRYERLFGQVSNEVCKQAVTKLFPLPVGIEMPVSLQ